MEDNLNKNIKIYYSVSFFTNCAFMLPVWIFFGRDYLDLSYSRTVFLGTFSFLTGTIFVIPTGSWSDRFGRKLTLILGLIFQISGTFLYLFTKNFYLLLLLQFCIGFGLAFISGSFESLIYNMLLKVDKISYYRNITGNKQIFLFLGRSSAAAFSGYLYNQNPRLPLTMVLMALSIALFISFFIYEPQYLKPKVHSDFIQIKNALRYVFRNNNLRYFLLFLFFFTGFANILFVSYQPYLQKIGTNVENIGLIYVFVSLFSALGSFVIKKSLKRIRSKVLIVVMYTGVFVSAILMSSFNLYCGITGILLISFFFGFQEPFTNVFVNPKLTEEIRATVMSLVAFNNSCAYLLFVYLAGYIFDNSELKVIFALSAVGALCFTFLSLTMISKIK